MTVPHREQGSHAQDMYLTQDTLHMGITRTKNRNSQQQNNKRARKEKSPKQGLTSARILRAQLALQFDKLNYLT